MNTQASCSRPFASAGWDLRLERPSGHCDVAICIVPRASVRQRPDEEPTSLRESVNPISGTFAHEVLNIRYAIGDLDQEDRRTRYAHPSEAWALALMVFGSLARAAVADRILLH